MDNISVIVSNDLRYYKQHIITAEEKLLIFFYQTMSFRSSLPKLKYRK